MYEGWDGMCDSVSKAAPYEANKACQARSFVWSKRLYYVRNEHGTAQRLRPALL